MVDILLLGARQCEARTIELPLASTFLEKNHRSGMADLGGNPIAYGLFHGEELVAVLMVCNPRTRGKQKRYTREIFRLAFLNGVRIRGGASKLISFFRKVENPCDFFTYQDTSGEATAVYEHAGMVLVEDAKPKKILVRDGLTAKTAGNNRRDWFSMEQAVRYGPDALIGTDLGEVFREDGLRKSNVELFLEHCGYHLETVPGDRVYEWLNPDFSFYTYKITSLADGFYYIGRRTIKVNSATIEDCLNDGYWGSGGDRFQRWKEAQPLGSLTKEILGIQFSRRANLAAEEQAVGTLYRDDPKCLNVMPGGLWSGTPYGVISLAICPTHGETKHRGSTCVKCSIGKSISRAHCPIHGETTHRGDSCVKCVQAKARSIKRCAIHGEVAHNGDACLKCAAKRAFSEKECSIHGLTAHHGDNCMKCQQANVSQIANCPIHGETPHSATTCMKCANGGSWVIEECPIHGESQHIGGLCSKCNFEAMEAPRLKSCPIHGETKHIGNACYKCSHEKSRSVKDCPIHGETKHMGSHCVKCSRAAAFSEKHCPIHGLAQHNGESCLKCSGQKSFEKDVCKTHGETQHRNGVCVKCKSAANWSIEECPIHGESKHLKGKCYKCVRAKATSTKECPVHGPSKHQGNRCMKCAQQKAKAKAQPKAV